MSALSRLSPQQIGRVNSWLGNCELVRDSSWNLVDTVVLHVRAVAGDFIVKAAGASNHHINREISAFREFTTPLSLKGISAQLINADAATKVLVLEYLEGRLVEGDPAEYEPDTYLQAGRALQLFHSQARRLDESIERAATDKVLSLLDSPHRIDRQQAEYAREILLAYEPRPAIIVPTHGDWQPRNWLIHDGHIRVIDFGRFAWRTAESDFVRLAAQQWRDNPELEVAFFKGYGSDPRRSNPTRWLQLRLREAVGTAVWAQQVGDERFEAQGHRMIREALVHFGLVR